MKKSGKIVLSGMCAGLATVLMMASYFPYLTYAVPAIAGLVMMILVIEIDVRWATLGFLASCLPVFLFAETEAKLLYIAFLGYYPILKAIIERVRITPVQYFVKLLCFNASVTLVYTVFSEIIGVSAEDVGIIGQYGIVVLLVSGNIVFLIYDFTISRMAQTYMLRLHRVVSRMMNK